jgi:signal transduction histidine kinase
MKRNETLGRMSGTTVRDFHDLLTVIKDQASLMLADRPNPDAARRLEDILWACDRCSTFTSQLVLLTQHVWAQPQTVDLTDLLAEMDLERWLPETMVVCRDLPGNPCRVEIDLDHLQHALAVLLTHTRNAVGDRGRIRISLDLLPTITLDGQRKSGWVHLEIADEGSSMASGAAAHGTDPLFPTRYWNSTGGPGLSMAHGVIRASGGRMRIDTSLSWGTHVHIWLPEAAAVRSHVEPVN